jgi:hypothetical protein
LFAHGLTIGMSVILFMNFAIYTYSFIIHCVHIFTSVNPLLLKLCFLNAHNRLWVSKHLESLWSWLSREWISYYTPKHGLLPWLYLPV